MEIEVRASADVLKSLVRAACAIQLKNLYFHVSEGTLVHPPIMNETNVAALKAEINCETKNVEELPEGKYARVRMTKNLYKALTKNVPRNAQVLLRINEERLEVSTPLRGAPGDVQRSTFAPCDIADESDLKSESYIPDEELLKDRTYRGLKKKLSVNHVYAEVRTEYLRLISRIANIRYFPPARSSIEYSTIAMLADTDDNRLVLSAGVKDDKYSISLKVPCQKLSVNTDGEAYCFYPADHMIPLLASLYGETATIKYTREFPTLISVDESLFKMEAIVAPKVFP